MIALAMILLVCGGTLVALALVGAKGRHFPSSVAGGGTGNQWQSRQRGWGERYVAHRAAQWTTASALLVGGTALLAVAKR